MKIQQLEYLLKAVECGSMSKAAQKLYISQPALTRSISQLEREFGVNLLRRKARGVELTREGVDFVYYARRIITAADALENVFEAKSAEKSCLFLASQQLDFIYDLLTRTYRENEQKGVHYNIIEGDRNSVANAVAHRQADVGFLVRSAHDAKSALWNMEGQQLEFHTLDQAKLFVCAGPRSPFYENESVTMEDTRKTLTIALDLEQEANQSLCLDNSENWMNMCKVIFANSCRACEHLLLETDGLMYVAKWAIGCLKDPRIHILPVQGEEAAGETSELCWCKRTGEPLNTTTRQFMLHTYERFPNAPAPTFLQS